MISAYKKKMLTILIVMLFGYFFYRLNRNEIYAWFCVNEQNYGACTVAGMLLKEQSNIAEATKYLELACSADYSQGCFHLGALYQDNGKMEESEQYLSKACRLKYEPACH